MGAWADRWTFSFSRNRLALEGGGEVSSGSIRSQMSEHHNKKTCLIQTHVVKQTVINLYRGILLGNKKEETLNA